MKTRKKKFTQLTLMMMLSLLGLIVAQETGKSRDTVYILDGRSMRDKIRGQNTFRPSNLGTAPGYGKRGDPLELSLINGDVNRPFASYTTRNRFPKRILIYWFLQQMRCCPEIQRNSLAQKVLNVENYNRPLFDQLMKSIGGIIRIH